MVKRPTILFLTIFMIFIPTCLGQAETGKTEPERAEVPTRQGLLRDGFAFSGIDGKVSSPDGDEWFFELDLDVVDDRIVVKEGTSLQLLPSATLQRIIDDMKIRSADEYRLWGTVTKYEGKNFIFPIYFLPLSKIEKPQEQKPIETPDVNKENSDFDKLPSGLGHRVEDSRAEPNINEPNDILAVPQEIIEKLKTRRIELTKWPEKAAGSEAEPNIQPQTIEKAGQAIQQDTILADRTAFLAEQDGHLVFTLDALGRSAPKISLRLLPCEALELTEQRQSTELEQPTFKIAGIITKYKDQNYLLLQRATQVYNYGNFAR
jgi:hypothetical protein